MTIERWEYLLVLATCVVVTAPLEAFGSGVYRQAARAARAVLPVAAVFVVWDVLAIGAHVWTYNPRFVTGLRLPGSLPIEEVLFFVVVPLCGILTYNAVDAILTKLRRSRPHVRRTG